MIKLSDLSNVCIAIATIEQYSSFLQFKYADLDYFWHKLRITLAAYMILIINSIQFRNCFL